MMPNKCQACNSGYEVDASSQCTTCVVSDCQTCVPSEPNSCQTCDADFFLTASKQCSACLMANCVTFTSNTCLCSQCESGFFLIPDRTACLASPPAGYYLPQGQSTFAQFPPGCLEVKSIGGKDQCVRCDTTSGFYQTNSINCTKTIPAGLGIKDPSTGLLAPCLANHCKDCQSDY